MSQRAVEIHEESLPERIVAPELDIAFRDAEILQLCKTAGMAAGALVTAIGRPVRAPSMTDAMKSAAPSFTQSLLPLQ